jgi:predicted site-specific integrase-resolvase
MKPELILDRTEACQKLGISRQTLLSWIQKGKLKIWKRVGHGTNAALLFERKHVEELAIPKETAATNPGGKSTNDQVRAS